MAVLLEPEGGSGTPVPKRLIELLVRFCLLREVIVPFEGCTTISDAVNVVLGLSELQLVGLVLCMYIPGTAVWEMCKRQKAPAANLARRKPDRTSFEDPSITPGSSSRDAAEPH